jgi:hypothetical protein
MGEARNAYKIFVGMPQGEKDLLGDISIDGRIILK